MKKLFLLLISMRPVQWSKNFVLFAGVIFSRGFISFDLLKESVYGFFIFCALSGGIYILNDVIDLSRDREHPSKSKRPLASGELPVPLAVIFAVIVIATGIGFAGRFGLEFLLISVAFVLLNVVYSIALRKVVILDVFSIAFSFLLRAVAGVAVLKPLVPDVELSPWLLICTLFLSLFLALCKRKHEYKLLREAQNHRESLKDYSANLLDQLVGLSATATLVSYSIYTIWPETVEKFETRDLVYTIPFVVFGIMRYLYLVYQRDKGGDPSGVLIMEKSILIDVFLWFVLVVYILLR